MADTTLFWAVITLGLVSGAAFFTWDARRYPAKPLYKWLPLLGWVLLSSASPLRTPG